MVYLGKIKAAMATSREAEKIAKDGEGLIRGKLQRKKG